MSGFYGRPQIVGGPPRTSGISSAKTHQKNCSCFSPTYLVGGFNHLEKYESQWEGLSHISHILWKIKNVPNHQPPMEVVTIKSDQL